MAVFAGHISEKSVMLGSAVFAAKSALKSGVGMIDFFGDKQTLVELIKMLPQAVGHTFESFEEQSGKWSSVVVGPGWEGSDKNVEMLARILRLESPVVIDGEALNILAANPDMLSLLRSKCILTPHLKEFERLKDSSNLDNSQKFTQKYGCTLVLKSSVTKVFDRDIAWEYKGNNPVLATGGTGDVLAGLIAGYAAQYYPKISLFDCAIEAVKAHAQAAEKYSLHNGKKGMLVNELIDNLE